MVTAYRATSRFDRATNATAFGLLAFPNFALALVLAYYVGVQLGWLPVSGYVAPSEDLLEHFRRMALPAIALAVGQIAGYMRLLRSDMIATLQEDFITMAKSKGISPSPGAVAPRAAAVEPDAADRGRAQRRHAHRRRHRDRGHLLVARHGHLLAEAVFARQYIALQSLVAIIAVGYVLVNFLVDILYSVLDPRIRHART